MAKLRGEIVTFGITESWIHAVDATVVVSRRGRAVASGVVDKFDRFEIALPPGLVGELEITVGTQGVAPALIDADGGNDLEVTMIFNPGGAYY